MSLIGDSAASVEHHLGGFFTPLRVRSIELPNRFVMAPMTRSYSPGGVPDEKVAQYYRRRIEGEVGLIISEGVGIDHPAALGGRSGANGEARVPDLHGSAIAGWRGVTEQVHAAGGLILAQLWHQGVYREEGTGPHPAAPSVQPSVIAEREIEALIDGFARSAHNAILAGFDGVEIHGAHGYLPDSFLFEETNQRTDRWGGNLERRARFPVEVTRAVRHAIGAERPLFYRFSQWKMWNYQARTLRTPAELETFLLPLVEAGVDVFDASQRRYDTPEFEGSNLNLAGWAKKLTGSLTMTVGGVGLDNGPEESKDVGGAGAVNDLGPLARRFANGEFDLVAVGRSLLQNADWTRRARLGLPFERWDERSRQTLK